MAQTSEHILSSEIASIDEFVKEECIEEMENVTSSQPFDIMASPSSNDEVIIVGMKKECNDDDDFIVLPDGIDYSGLFYAYQEDIITSNDGETIPLTNTVSDSKVFDKCPPETDANLIQETFSFSSDHSYTCLRMDDDSNSQTNGAALKFYERFCKNSDLIDLNDNDKPSETMHENNIQVSEIVYLKTEDGDNIEEITFLVNTDSDDNIDLENSYTVLANGDNSDLDPPVKKIALPKLTAPKTGQNKNFKIVNSASLNSSSTKAIYNNVSFVNYAANSNTNDISFKIDNFDGVRPPYSYSQLIVQAIASTPEKQMTLNGIYSFITQNYKYYRETDEKGWKNSIRHNLSLNPHFYHVPRLPDVNELSRKGGYWRMDAILENRLVQEAYAKKKKSYENKKYVKYLSCNKPKTLTT